MTSCASGGRSEARLEPPERNCNLFWHGLHMLLASSCAVSGQVALRGGARKRN